MSSPRDAAGGCINPGPPVRWGIQGRESTAYISRGARSLPVLRAPPRDGSEPRSTDSELPEQLRAQQGWG